MTDDELVCETRRTPELGELYREMKHRGLSTNRPACEP